MTSEVENVGQKHTLTHKVRVVGYQRQRLIHMLPFKNCTDEGFSGEKWN